MNIIILANNNILGIMEVCPIVMNGMVADDAGGGKEGGTEEGWKGAILRSSARTSLS